MYVCMYVLKYSRYRNYILTPTCHIGIGLQLFNAFQSQPQNTIFCRDEGGFYSESKLLAPLSRSRNFPRAYILT